jgi:hypothetical protein
MLQLQFCTGGPSKFSSISYIVDELVDCIDLDEEAALDGKKWVLGNFRPLYVNLHKRNYQKAHQWLKYSIV